ncbi:hypothetical protein EF405_11450 [Cyclobacteriaceae bacterium YHN15]|nr:hypothetical protein EF405_11450 [Cyclobacteriaceae bacterium YHN15]
MVGMVKKRISFSNNSIPLNPSNNILFQFYSFKKFWLFDIDSYFSNITIFINFNQNRRFYR